MWEVKKMADGNFSVRNMATGMYVNHNDVVDGQDKNLNLTDALETEQVMERLNPSGQFLIHSAGANWTYNVQGHGAGANTEGPISNWTDKAINGEGAWYITPVSAEDLATAELTKNYDVLKAKVESFTGNYSVGTDPGQYSQAPLEALKAEVATAKEMVADTTGKYTETDYAAELAKYDAAKKAFDASLVTITDGYYAIATLPYSSKQTNGGGSALSQKFASDPWIVAPAWDEANPMFIWKIKSLGGDRYSIQNYVSGLYINSTDLITQAAAINMSTTQTTAQLLTRKSGQTYSMSNVVTNAKNLGYLLASDIVYLVTNPSNVYLHKYTDEEVEKIAAGYPQRLRNDSLNALIAKTSASLGIDSVYTIDLTTPLVTNASQLYVNNLSTETPNVGNMIDGNTSTFVVSDWGGGTVNPDGNYHSIRIDAGEGKTLPTHVGVKWTKRMDQHGGTSRPTDIIFYASDDANTWVNLKELKNPDAKLPTTDDTPEYTSPVISTGKPFRYFKMEVIANVSNVTGSNGKPYFSFSEFNLYPYIGAPAEMDDELKQALSDLRAAIATAQPKADAGTATSQDIADLQKAYTAFLLVYKDTTDLYKTYATATSFAPSVTPGYEMFCFPDDKVSAFEDAWSEVDEARPFTDINQKEVARLDTLLTRAYNDLTASMIGPDPDTWYTVFIADQYAKDASGNSVTGQVAWMGGNTAVDGLGAAGGDASTFLMNDPRRAWKFEPTGEPFVYNMICCGNGWPIGRGPVRLKPLGEGQFAILTGGNMDQTYFIAPNVLPGVPAGGNLKATKDSIGAWTMQPAPEELTRTMKLQYGRIFAVCFPFETYGLPLSPDGTEIDAYKICGYTLADDGKTVTGINLTKMEDEGIPAATPFIIKVGGDVPYDGDSLITVDYLAKINGTVSRDLTTQNGLTGTFSSINLPAGMIYLTKDSAYVEPENFNVIPQRCFINVNAITIDPNAKVDLVVPVSGKVEQLTAINSTVSKQPAIVDVYTPDGVMVKRGVKAAEATKSLAPGVYIVGKKKVLVK